MRRTDRELTDKKDLEAILKAAKVCRVAFHDGEAPYIVPLNYGYRWDQELILYFHGAAQGKKIDLIKLNPLVGFELDLEGSLIQDEKACEWGMHYQSLIGKGRVEMIDDQGEKEFALDQIMKQYGFQGKPAYDQRMFSHMGLYRIRVKEMTGKRKA